MNYDRLKVRVFDTQEKKMLYLGDEVITSSLTSTIFIGFTDSKMITAAGIFEYGDRFIPMLCSGWKDCDKELVYEFDIVNGFYCGIDLPVERITRGVVNWIDACFDVYQDHKFICPLSDLTAFNVRGNAYEDSEFLEEKTNDTTRI